MVVRHSACGLIAAFALLIATTPLRAQEVWLAPNPKAGDLQNMFSRDALWQNAASRTKVFVLYAAGFVSTMPQPQLDAIVADLKRRRIAIAIETGMMNVPGKPRPVCGGWGWVEGYGPVPLHALVAKKIKQAGGIIKYVAMDEPLWYGHYFTHRLGSQPGCQAAIDDVAKLVAPAVNEYTKVFPSVVIGDIEPANVADVAPSRLRNPNWKGDLSAWASDFRSSTGRPLGFLQIDVGWIQPDAVPHAMALYKAAQGLIPRGLLGEVGIIYNGNPTDTTDASWMNSARNNMTLMEGEYGLRPGQVVIQSWHPEPSHAIPESSPDALTSLVDFYGAHHWSQ